MLEAVRSLVQATSVLMTCVIVSVFVPPELIVPTNQTVGVRQYDPARFREVFQPKHEIIQEESYLLISNEQTGEVIEESTKSSSFFDSWWKPAAEPVEGELVGEIAPPAEVEEPSSWWKPAPAVEVEQPAEVEETKSWWSTPEKEKEPEVVEETKSWWSTERETEPEVVVEETKSWWSTEKEKEPEVVVEETKSWWKTEEVKQPTTYEEPEVETYNPEPVVVKPAERYQQEEEPLRHQQIPEG